MPDAPLRRQWRSHAIATTGAAWRALYEEALSIHRESSDGMGTASHLYDLGHVLSLQGDRLLALSCHRESLMIRRSLGELRGVAESLEAIAISTRENAHRSARLLA